MNWEEANTACHMMITWYWIEKLRLYHSIIIINFLLYITLLKEGNISYFASSALWLIYHVENVP